MRIGGYVVQDGKVYSTTLRGELIERASAITARGRDVDAFHRASKAAQAQRELLAAGDVPTVPAHEVVAVARENAVQRRLERAAARRRDARVEFEAAIVAARDAGLSWAVIARAAGLSVEGVRKIAARTSS
jgi:hypothetical protein